MSKAILSTLVATLIGVAASTAHAANGISTSTLADMGLSGLTVMSDSDALAIRGKGYAGGSQNGGCRLCGPRAKKEPWSAAAGNSFANIRLGGECPDCVPRWRRPQRERLRGGRSVCGFGRELLGSRRRSDQH